MAAVCLGWLCLVGVLFLAGSCGEVGFDIYCKNVISISVYLRFCNIDGALEGCCGLALMQEVP